MTLSAPLVSRTRTILVSLETDKGTTVTATTPVKVFDLKIDPTSPWEQRKGSGIFLGAGSPGVHGERSGKCTFKAELRGNGAHGCDAGLAILLQAVAFVKATESYSLSSTIAAQKCITIAVNISGVLFGLVGAMGKVKFAGMTGGRMMLSFDFDGIWVAPSDVALPAYAPSTTAPLRMQAGTFTLATLAIKIAKYELDTKNNVVMRGDVTGVGGIAHYLISDYDPEVSIDPEADLVAGHGYHAAYLAGTEAAVVMTMTDGTDVATFTLPKVQYKDLKEGDRGGIQIYELTGQCNKTSDTVNAAVTIAFT